jgi:hypothetical protein
VVVVVVEVVVEVELELVVVEVVVEVELELVVSQGFGVQTRNNMKRPPSTPHSQRPWMLHWSKGPPGVLCVQHAEGGVVVVACAHGAGPVQLPGPTLIPWHGSPGCMT